MDLTVIITDHIDYRFCWVRYDDFEFIIMKENGYINATKLCILGNRRLSDWLDLKSTKELIKDADYVNGNWKVRSSSSDSRGVILYLDNDQYLYEVSGYYIHQDIIPHLTTWISPLFSLKVSKIINCYLIAKYERRLNEKEEINKDLLKLFKGLYNKHDSDIAELKENYRAQKEQIKSLDVKYSSKIEELKYHNTNTLYKQKKSEDSSDSDESNTIVKPFKRHTSFQNDVCIVGNVLLSETSPNSEDNEICKEVSYNSLQKNDNLEVLSSQYENSQFKSAISKPECYSKSKKNSIHDETSNFNSNFHKKMILMLDLHYL
ncbi:SWPV1-196 [Shearwaterpox virus]|uniref:SWPV1-196 n=1 Tax=Shearwaterpox virus TaxID=1974596 RepID=A0A1V0S819_CNPV|nr:SWPV1-196 [Shearwaterpox virus]